MECTKCTARGCGYEENIQHLVYCPTIYAEYWERVDAFMHKLGLGGGFNITFWITGVKSNGKKIDNEGASIWFWAWRTLYAQVTYSHINNTFLNLKRAYAKLVQMTLSRVKAYGGKWYLWYTRQRFHKKSKLIPVKHRKYKLITTSAMGNYTINQVIYDEANNTRKDL